MGNVTAIVASGGTGRRMGRSVPKQFLEIGGKPVLIHTLLRFEGCDAIDTILLTAPAEALETTQRLVQQYGIGKVSQVVPGGRERQESIWNALVCVDDTAEIVLVHDGVRPLVTQAQITQVVQTAREKGAVILAAPSVNTIKRVNNGVVAETLERSQLWQVQTPQGFRADLLRQAYQFAREKKVAGTDDASLVEAAGHPVFIVPGDDRNLKITSPVDLKVAEVLLKEEP